MINFLPLNVQRQYNDGHIVVNTCIIIFTGTVSTNADSSIVLHYTINASNRNEFKHIVSCVQQLNN